MKRMMWVVVLLLLVNVSMLHAQGDDEKKGFQKERLFTGGGVSLGFGNRSFQAGANPMLGYSIANWIDAGIVVNYIYSSFRDLYGSSDKLRQSMYGGGAFARLYPVNFLFVQGQLEHNFIKQKYIAGNGAGTASSTVEANSLLLGAGYASNRNPGSGQPFFYLAIMFDVLNQRYSPYSDEYNRAIPILRAGVQVPLFQGRNRY